MRVKDWSWLGNAESLADWWPPSIVRMTVPQRSQVGCALSSKPSSSCTSTAYVGLGSHPLGRRKGKPRALRSPHDSGTQLDVRLSAICGRDRYTRDPAPILAELPAAAGDRGEILARVAGTWTGYFDSPETHIVAAALAALRGAAEWAQVGQRRRDVAAVIGPGGAR